MADILIVEDDLKLCGLMESLLSSQGHNVLTAMDGREGIKQFWELGCDVMILDLRLPILGGIQVLERIHRSFSVHPPIIIVTGHGDKSVAINSLRLGAFDFLEKPFSPELLESTVQRALREKKDAIDHFRALINKTEKLELTDRERQIASLASQGLSNPQISEQLGLGTETVKTHLKKIFRKLGVTNRTALSGRLRKAG